MRRGQAGNVLFMILIAVALFAALSYAVTNSNRSGYGDASKEQAELDQAVIDNYLACINSGQMTLNIARGCSSINYDPPSAWSGSDFDCHMFHPEGAGCAHQDLGLNECDTFGLELTDLDIGESCNGIIYAGESGGNRIYTTATDHGSTSWSNTSSGNPDTGATSLSDGVSNTDILVASSDAGSPYHAAILCRALGSEWYLPSRNELDLLYQNLNEGDLDGTFDESGLWYWSSSQSHTYAAWRRQFSTGTHQAGIKWSSNLIRCVRSD